ncbi:MAG: insulinase family protein, partial [Clostridia bacterium]|nr:insulinase family protein [Clostridia bacterium]
GVKIICEKIPHVRTAAVGIFVNVGSRDETPSANGSAHCIEHMLFKRTSKHSAAELAFEMDAIGGQINAYTTRESTCFYARVLDTHLKAALGLLTEMFFDCAFDEDELRSERGVILEEIGMYEDTPDDACYEKLMSGCYKGALGRPVLGKPNTLGKMTGTSLREFKESRYTAGNIVVSLCGSYDDSHIEYIKERFSVMEKSRRRTKHRTEYGSHISVRRKKTEQNQLCIAFPSNPVSSEERFAMNLLITILGGGVSSRLFQNIREKYGLCYSIFAFQSSFADTGLASVSTAVAKDADIRTLGLIRDELRRFVDDGVSSDELQRAREQAKSSLVMSLGSTNAR